MLYSGLVVSELMHILSKFDEIKRYFFFAGKAIKPLNADNRIFFICRNFKRSIDQTFVFNLYLK